MLKKENIYKPKTILIQNNEVEAIDYNLNVLYYSASPQSHIDYDCAQDLIEERISILSALDDIKEDFNSIKGNSNFYLHVKEKLSEAKCPFKKNFFKVLCSSWNPLNNEQIDGRKRDQLSHFLLRLYYCQNENLRKWFVSKETQLLRIRLMDENNRHHLESFINVNQFKFQKIESDHPKYSKLVKKISFSRSQLFSNKIYKIPFDQALELVKARKVYVHKGYAYIYLNHMISVICQLFRQELNTCLISLFCNLPNLGEDNRLLPLLHAVHVKYFPSFHCKDKFQINSFVIKLESIDFLSQHFFPPCMQRIHNHLKTHHHIRHFSRLYYGQFLKNLGLNLEDAISFFKQEFTQKMSKERFDRSYKPNIYYNYFTSTKGLNRSAFSCLKIINNNPPGPLDVHGCPFRYLEETQIKQFLSQQHFNQNDCKKILSLISSQNYLKACSEYFSIKFPTYLLSKQGIYHPNQFFNESYKASQLNS